MLHVIKRLPGSKIRPIEGLIYTKLEAKLDSVYA